MFIAHDLAVVKNVSDRVAVMYLGKMCEVGPADAALRPAGPPLHRGAARVGARARPRHARWRTPALEGDLPSPLAPPSGCRFRTRCPRAQDRCAEEEPMLRQVAADGDGEHVVACHFPLVDVV